MPKHELHKRDARNEGEVREQAEPDEARAHAGDAVFDRVAKREAHERHERGAIVNRRNNVGRQRNVGRANANQREERDDLQHLHEARARAERLVLGNARVDFGKAEKGREADGANGENHLRDKVDSNRTKVNCTIYKYDKK